MSSSQPPSHITEATANGALFATELVKQLCSYQVPLSLNRHDPPCLSDSTDNVRILSKSRREPVARITDVALFLRIQLWNYETGRIVPVLNTFRPAHQILAAIHKYLIFSGEQRHDLDACLARLSDVCVTQAAKTDHDNTISERARAENLLALVVHNRQMVSMKRDNYRLIYWESDPDWPVLHFVEAQAIREGARTVWKLNWKNRMDHKMTWKDIHQIRWWTESQLTEIDAEDVSASVHLRFDVGDLDDPESESAEMSAIKVLDGDGRILNDFTSDDEGELSDTMCDLDD